MLIGGIQKTTLIDYPGKIASTIFTIGCNFRCPFCHNPELVNNTATQLEEVEILNFFESRKNLLDAICITGGEPTIHVDLPDFIKKIKDMGFAVKLDTNGTNPKMLQELLDKKLIDYVAMDIKAPWSKYQEVVRQPIDVEAVKKSVEILKNNEIDYEFRSTVLPKLHTKEDLIEMANQIKGADKYFLQKFRAVGDLVDVDFKTEKIYTSKELNDIIKIYKDWFNQTGLRT